jgi:uncharacterized protein (TIGR00297 family)
MGRRFCDFVFFLVCRNHDDQSMINGSMGVIHIVLWLSTEYWHLSTGLSTQANNPLSISALLVGFGCGGLIGYLAWRARALSRSGAWAAMVVGGLIFGLGGPSWAALLLTFFVSSSGLSWAFPKAKLGLNAHDAKGSQRDAGQVFANGGLGALCALIARFSPGAIWPWALFVGAMAAVNADTWATEIGAISPTPPRLVTSGRIVDRGASGGVTLTGSLAALVGAALVAAVAWMFQPAMGAGLFVAAALGGLCGSFCDSFLGATVQAIFYCPTCHKETERSPRHHCGSTTTLQRGWLWVNNDLVNFACSLAGALATLLIWQLWYHG